MFSAFDSCTPVLYTYMIYLFMWKYVLVKIEQMQVC